MLKLHRSDLLRELKVEFPQTTAELNSQDGSLYGEIEVFRRFAQRAVFDGDRELAARCFSIAEKYFLSGNAAMRDCIDVGFVEEFEFRSPRKDRQWAWDMFPTCLKEAYVAFHRKPGI
jgi:hypothetical protein